MKRPPRYFIYGTHAVQAAISNEKRDIIRVLGTKNALSQLSTLKHHAEVVDAKTLSKLVGQEAVHQGIAAEVVPLEQPTLEDIFTCHKSLFMLDQVTDPHNIGAILRSAMAFDMGAIILPKDNSPLENAVMAKAACGALEHIPLIYVTNLAKGMAELKEAGYWMIGLDSHAKQSIGSITLDSTSCIVLGAEGKGMRRLTRDNCDHLAHIPMNPGMESLNVSNAASITGFLCYQSAK